MKNWHRKKPGSAQGKLTQLAKVITWWDAILLLKYTCGPSRAHCFIVVCIWPNGGVYIFHYTALQQRCSCSGYPPWDGTQEALMPRFPDRLEAGICVFLTGLGHPVVNVLIYLHSSWHKRPYSKDPKIVVHLLFLLM